ncbi:hypothetical protein C8J56DRAFT_814332 [Mycena floridula]|nr:hypothetical protein C8J56DRAFT_814332 [Mycena floridula]
MDAVQAQATVVGIPPKELNPSVFTSYIREAKIYDEAMVARWKIAMDGILLFAALFSAVVTAFIIESYKLLSPDPANITLLILYQISQQLVNGSETTVLLPKPSEIPFSPSVAAVLTNVFWFLSLALGLSCALAATLIQQWASEYIHAIERRQVPEMRGRIRAFLFEGVERSKVSAIVEGTPALLHASLFSFLIGLVFFLRPINNVVTYLMSGLLIICGTAYFYATIAPLISISSPIRTPLTTFILQFSFVRNTVRIVIGKSWMKSISVAQLLSKSTKELVSHSIRLLHQFSILFSRHALNNISIIESEEEEQRSLWSRVSSLAQKVFSHRVFTTSADQMLTGGNLDEIREKIALDKDQAGFQARETRALTWTLDCLTTDIEFMQFIEGVPSYLDRQRNGRTMQYLPKQIMAALLRHDDYAFARKQLSSLVDQPYPTERSMSAALGLITSLAGSTLFPYNLFPEEKKYEWDVIPVVSLYYHAVEEFPSLSLASNRTKFLTIIQCSQDVISKRNPAFRPEYCRHVLEWVHDLSFMDNTAYPAILRGKELDEFKRSIDMLKLSPGTRLHIPLDAPKVKAALASCILTGLCDFFFKEINNPSQTLETESIYRCTRFTSFLVSGSPGEQQAYASVVWLITVGLTYQYESSVANELRIYLLTSLLEPLVKITDVNALQTVRKILASTVWWDDVSVSQAVNDGLQNSQIMRDPAIASIYWIKGLPVLFHASSTTDTAIASHLEQRPSTLSGLHSTLQNEYIGCLERFGNADVVMGRKALAAALFCLAGTLDDVMAVTRAIKLLERFIFQLDILYQNSDQTRKGGEDLLEAKEALERLKETASELGFAYKALALRLDE